MNNKKKKKAKEATSRLLLLGGTPKQVDTTTHKADPNSVEKLVKQFKTHLCALNFDTTFFNAPIYVFNLT